MIAPFTAPGSLRCLVTVGLMRYTGCRGIGVESGDALAENT